MELEVRQVSGQDDKPRIPHYLFLSSVFIAFMLIKAAVKNELLACSGALFDIMRESCLEAPHDESTRTCRAGSGDMV